MRQLTSAIVEAHRSNIIHRDIKPQNILLKSDGSVIITDFGIALAQNALHLTQKEMVMGSVHYLAPELARGETATYQSDIYALGIVFYELLTGSVPYKGDTAIQIAMQHINDPLPKVRDTNPMIPQSVENNIIKATYKNRELRFASAADMLADLDSVLSEERKDEAVLADIISSGSHDTTKVISSIDALENDKKKKQNAKKKNLIIALASILVISIIAILVWPRTEIPVEIEVPDIVNLTIEEARAALEELGFVVGDISRELDEEIELNKIVSQDPKAKELIEEGSSINLVISDGKYITFENYVGKNIDSVREELANTSIRIRIEYVSDISKSMGTIISQSITAGEKLNPNTVSEVQFVVVKAPEFTIPDSIYGLDINGAKALLESLGATVRLEAITDGNGSLVAGEKINIVEYSSPAKGSFYVQNESNVIVLYYYSKEIPVEPDPKPEEKPNETPPANKGEEEADDKTADKGKEDTSRGNE
ncbi:MAG: PASTA domain-containing protein [Erysipelothrix sp.]|nr:PASTA domain-containing protein [Erysipelothrix sp.]